MSFLVYIFPLVEVDGHQRNLSSPCCSILILQFLHGIDELGYGVHRGQYAPAVVHIRGPQQLMQLIKEV